MRSTTETQASSCAKLTSTTHKPLTRLRSKQAGHPSSLRSPPLCSSIQSVILRSSFEKRNPVGFGRSYSKICCGGVSIQSSESEDIKPRTPIRRLRNFEWDKNEQIDVVSLNNLCVDIILQVDNLPASRDPSSLSTLTSGPPPSSSYWEVGGASNFAIAAARLGLTCLCLGHLGRDVYGDFMLGVMDQEGVKMMQVVDGSFPEMCQHSGSFFEGPSHGHPDKLKTLLHPLAFEDTLLCWVFVDPQHRHGFCSRFDFTTVPLLDLLESLPPKAMGVIRSAEAMIVNGFVFDELSPNAVEEAVGAAKQAGTAVFFDAGPRGSGLMKDVPGGGRRALEYLLRVSDVLLLTQEEAETVTGIRDPEEAAQSLLRSPGSLVNWVVLKVGPKGCFLVTHDETSYHPAMKIEVEDTVGCGDSLAAGIVLGYCRGYDKMTTLAIANAVGGSTACRSGAGRNVATTELICSLLQSSIESCEGSDGNVYRESAQNALRLLRTGKKSAKYLL
eukprot:CAMPEP_0196583462 /NCGR_PEP_ID=MMETSP1081-20130531/43761_1 /TAXON_ID=36882 /ORGANISM="Pyramimonas amylifera, Strain CCMP720" /LENGTH=499 /DNA_ID=CAMNT_0041904369 /DNA_START=246 /DNA_END=1745 /DNA_ORIENTATION=+